MRKIPLPTVHFCSALLILLGACSAPPDPGEDEPVAAEQAAIAVTWDTPACSIPTNPTPTACNGSWEYWAWDMKLGNAADCGTSCTAWNKCDKWNHGVSTGPQQTTTATATQSCTTRCEQGPGGQCHTYCGSVNMPVCTPALEANRENSLIGQMNAELDALDMSAADRADRKDVLSTKIKQVTRLVDADMTVTETTDSTDTEAGETIRVFHKTYKCTSKMVNAERTEKATSQCTCKTTTVNTCYVHETSASTKRYSNPGATKPADKTGDVDVEATSAHPTRCLTCDDKALVNAKYTCLMDVYDDTFVASALPSGVTPAKIKQAVVARLKVLAELYGWNGDPKLSEAQFTAILPLYSQAGTATCHAAFDVPASCKPHGQASGLNNRLQFCENLLRYNTTTQATRTFRLDFCLGSFDLVGTIADPTCHGEYLDAVTLMAHDLVESEMTASSWYGIRLVGGQLTGLTESFKALQKWYTHARLAGGGAVWMQAETNAVVTVFWTHVHDVTSLTMEADAAAKAADPTQTGTDLKPILDSISGNGLQTDIRIASAVVQATDLNTPPLLMILGDALRPIVERAETLSESHDLVCRFRECSTTSSTRVGELWHIMSVLHDRAKLVAAVDAAPRLEQTRPDVWGIFDKLSTTANHGRFTNAYLLAVQDGVQVATLHSLAELAGARWRNFTTSGQFLGQQARELYAGMQNRDLIVSQFRLAVQEFEAQYTNYKNDRKQLVTALINEIGAATNQQALGARFDRLVADIDDVRRRLEVVRDLDIEERTKITGMELHFTELRDNGVFPDTDGANVQPLATLQLSAGNARMDGSKNSVANFAVQAPGWPRQLEQGEMLRFQVSGMWSPSCALPSSIAGITEQSEFHVSKQGALAGPEGYTVTWNNTEFEAKSFNWDASAREYTKAETCIKTEYGSPEFVKTVWGGKASAVMQACAGVDLSMNEAYGGQNGNDHRTSASFGGGIRLGNTPITDAPAGALLLVATVKNQPTNIVDIQVVHRQSAFIAPSDVDVYLVVNDKADCVADTTNKLTVDASQITPFGLIAAQLMTSMSLAIAELEFRADGVVAQGELMQGEADALRGLVNDRLLSDGLDPTQLPPKVRVFLDAYISAEIASLGRRAAMHRQERELARLDSERLAIGYELAGAESAYPLSQLLTRWELRELERNMLYLSERAVLQQLRELVAPVLELRYRPALIELLTSADAAKSADAELDALEDLDFEATSDVVAARLLALSKKVLARLEAAALTDQNHDVIDIGVVIPRPECYADADGNYDAAHCPCNATLGKCPDRPGEAPQDDTLPFPNVPYETAVAAWAAFTPGPDGTYPPSVIELRPEHVYRIEGGQYLTCRMAVPVVAKSALLFTTRSGTVYGNPDLSLPVDLARQVSFPTLYGLIGYALADSWQVPALPGIIAGNNDARTLFQQSSRVVGTGLSPFVRMTVNMASVRAKVPHNDLGSMVLIYRVDYRGINDPGVDLPICRNPPPPDDAAQPLPEAGGDDDSDPQPLP